MTWDVISRYYPYSFPLNTNFAPISFCHKLSTTLQISISFVSLYFSLLSFSPIFSLGKLVGFSFPSSAKMVTRLYERIKKNTFLSFLLCSYSRNLIWYLLPQVVSLKWKEAEDTGQYSLLLVSKTTTHRACFSFCFSLLIQDRSKIPRLLILRCDTIFLLLNLKIISVSDVFFFFFFC